MTTLAVDLILLAIVALAALRGWRQGLTLVGLRWAGLLVGALLGWHLARAAPPAVTPPLPWRWLFIVGVVGMVAALGAALGGAGGRRMGSLLRRIHLGLPDRVGGAVARGALALVATWIVVSLATGVLPRNPVTDVAAESAVLNSVTQVLGSPNAALEEYVAPALR